MENAWLNNLKRLRALATCGLNFSTNDYEKDRYQDILDIVLSMLSDIGNVPIEKLESVLQFQVHGYETPKIDVRAAVVKDNKILLVQEKTDNLWALPGGYADVGLSAAENTVKEVHEEAGIDVSVDLLYALRHKAKGDYKNDVRDFYKLFFVCSQKCESAVVAGSEVLDAQFFHLDALPELSTGRVIYEDIENAFFYSKNINTLPFFDL